MCLNIQQISAGCLCVLSLTLFVWFRVPHIQACTGSVMFICLHALVKPPWGLILYGFPVCSVKCHALQRLDMHSDCGASCVARDTARKAPWSNGMVQWSNANLMLEHSPVYSWLCRCSGSLESVLTEYLLFFLKSGKAKSLLWRCAAEGRGVHPLGVLSVTEATASTAVRNEKRLQKKYRLRQAYAFQIISDHFSGATASFLTEGP